jgi:hypothetical protein
MQFLCALGSAAATIRTTCRTSRRSDFPLDCILATIRAALNAPGMEFIAENGGGGAVEACGNIDWLLLLQNGLTQIVIHRYLSGRRCRIGQPSVKCLDSLCLTAWTR